MRGLSIVLVLLHHAGVKLGPFTGLTGVTVFFVISGYLITDLLLQEKASRGRISLKNFYGRRALRIFPAFYCFLAAMVVARALGWVQFSGGEFLASATYWRNLYHGGPSVLEHTWSLSVEEQFYLGWPFLLAILPTRFAGALAVAGLFSRPLLRWFFRGILAYDDGVTALNAAGLETILVGCLLAIALHERTWRTWLLRALCGRYRFLAVAAAIYGLHWSAPLVHGPVTLTLPLARDLLFAALIFAALVNRNELSSRFLAWKPVSSVGVISYSLYLWQQPFLIGSPGARSPLHPAIGLTLAVGAALLSYRLVERPLLALRRRLRTPPGADPAKVGDGRPSPSWLWLPEGDRPAATPAQRWSRVDNPS